MNTAITNKKKYSSLKVHSHTTPEYTQQNKQDNNLAKIDLLYKCIAQLNASDRALILLHLEGYDYEEVSDIIGISVNLVGVKLSRIRKRLYNILINNGYGKL